jgi:hypothetical protein
MVDLAGRFYEAGDNDAQRRMLARVRAMTRSAKLPTELALADCRRAQSYVFDDKFDSARADLAEARAALTRVRTASDSGVLKDCFDAEGQLLAQTGAPDSGIKLLRRVVDLTAVDRVGTGRPAALISLSQAVYLDQRFREAAAYAREAADILDAAGYADTEILPNVISFLVLPLWEMGEPAALDTTLRRYIREEEAVRGAGRTSTLLALFYGQAKLRLGATDSAEVWIARAMRDTTQGTIAFPQWLPATMVELRIEQGRLAEAKQSAAHLPLTSRGRRITGAWLRARIQRALGDTAGASASLEATLRAVSTDGKPTVTLMSLPLVSAGEWRLAAGDARGADSLARLARTVASRRDTLALTRSVFVGRAEMVDARALRALGDAAGARRAAARAVVALGNGYGPANDWTRGARALLDSLSR